MVAETETYLPELPAAPPEKAASPPLEPVSRAYLPNKGERRRKALLSMWLEPFRPGMRVAVATSGGADSVALLRALVHLNTAHINTSDVNTGLGSRLGLVLSVAHMHHGIRGQAADEDASFVESLANNLSLRLFRKNVNAPALAGRDSIGLEEAARNLRYAWFAELLSSGAIDAIATAHTLNDQAETVLHKLLRGAWTEGLAGIHPVLRLCRSEGNAAANGGQIVRPLLGVTREQVVAWLTSIRQDWREDPTNVDLQFTRNRIRHQLLPELTTFNPRVSHQLAHMASIALDEEAYWQKEVERLLPGLLLPGRAVRGGGRASSTVPGERSLAIEVERLRGLHPALVRRLLRGAARQLGVALNFEETARLFAMVDGRTDIRREELTVTLRAERTPRELRLLFSATADKALPNAAVSSAVEIPVPGQGEAFGWRLSCSPAKNGDPPCGPALLRTAAPGDKVQLRYSRGAPKRIKEVLERIGVTAPDRAAWPLLVWDGEIVWMQGVLLEPTPTSQRIRVDAEELGQG